MDGFIVIVGGFLQLYIMINLPIWIGVVEKPRVVPRGYKGIKTEKKGGKTRGKYYMNEIPKGMSEDTLIMNDVINFEEAFK